MLQIAELFGDNMVLQRDKKIKVWGKGKKDSAIIIEIQNCSVKVCSDENGDWCTELPPLNASEEETLVISDETETITYTNVAVGEVWVAGGQSNMEFFMRYDKNFEEEAEYCENKNIRFFDYPVLATETMKSLRDFSLFGFWRRCDKDNIQYYSATAYYFAKNLQEALKVPIGIIGCNCGGTRACCWMDEETVQECGPVWMEDYERDVASIPDLEKAEADYLTNEFVDKSHPFSNPLAEKMLYGIPKEELKRMFQEMSDGGSGNTIGPWHEWRPCGLYHTMLKKIAPYTIKGVIWYQGESDEEHPEIYADMMCGLIRCWRREWEDQIPFIMTQLAPLGEEIGLGGKFYPILREQQEEVTRRMEKVYCASIGDVGSDYDIHPKEKRPVGIRLALLARGHVYGEKILCEAPTPKSVERQKETLIITFANAEGGLSVEGKQIQAIQIFDCHGREVLSKMYRTEVTGNQLLIHMKTGGEMEGMQIAFAKTPFYEVNIYNASRIPVKPFLLKV